MEFFCIKSGWMANLRLAPQIDGLYQTWAIIHGVRWVAFVDKMGWGVASPNPTATQIDEMVNALVTRVIMAACA